jgi:hypothetical protein
MLLVSLPIEEDVSRLFVTAYKALIVLSTELRAVLTPGSPHRFLSDRRGRPLPHPPNCVDIPFPSLLKLPSIFSPFDCLRTFNACHITRMTSSLFLEDGEWSGYISHRAAFPPHRDRVTFQPPIYRLRFQARQSAVDPSATALRSTVHNSPLDDFAFFGMIRRNTGVLRMKQKYQQASLELFWQGIMTPFGMLATIDEATSTSKGSWLWLWKESWNSPASSTLSTERDLS